MTLMQDKYPLAIHTRVFARSSLDASLRGGTWSAVFPKTMMLERSRSTDRIVTFSNGAQKLQLCVFPAEVYGSDPAVLLPSTRPVLDETAAEILSNDAELIAILVAVGLLGLAFFF